MYIQLNNIPMRLAKELADACRAEIACSVQNGVSSADVLRMSEALDAIESAIQWEKEAKEQDDAET